MPDYECAVVFDGLLPEEDLNTLQERVQGIITQNDADLTRIDPWGKRRLAYEIKKRSEGYYVVYYFSTSDKSKALADLDRFCRIEEGILRHLILHQVVPGSGKPPAEVQKEAPDVAPEETAPADVETTPVKEETQGEVVEVVEKATSEESPPESSTTESNAPEGAEEIPPSPVDVASSESGSSESREEPQIPEG